MKTDGLVTYWQPQVLKSCEETNFFFYRFTPHRWTMMFALHTDGTFFPQVILRQLKEKPARRRVGLTCSGPPPRTHCPIIGPDGSKVGEVSACLAAERR